MVFFASVLIALCVIGGFFLLKTNSGAHVLARSLKTMLPGHLTYDKISGHILGHLEINNIQYSSSSMTIALENIIAENTFSLLKRTFINKKLVLNHIYIKPGVPEKSSHPTSHHFFIPIKFELQKILIRNLQLQLTKNKAFIIPTLDAVVKGDQHCLYANAITDENPHSLINYQRDSETSNLDVKFPISKTLLEIHYQTIDTHFSLNGTLKDNKQGKIVLGGSGIIQDDWHVQVEAKNFHAEALWPDYLPGSVSFDLSAIKKNDDTTIRLRSISGSINDQLLQGKGFALIQKDQIPHMEVQLESNNNKINISGSKLSDWHVQWAVNVSDLHNFIPHSKGRFATQGVFNGTYLQPALKGTFQIQDLLFSDFSADTLSSQFEFEQHKSTASLVGKNIKWHHITLSTLEFRGLGNLAKHAIELNASTKLQHLTLHLNGTLKNKIWSALLDNLTILTEKESWKLQTPTHLSFDNKNWTVDYFCLQARQNSVCLQGKYGTLPLQGKLEIRNFDLSLLNFLFNETQKLEGRIDVRAEANFKKRNKILHVSANLKPGAFYYPLNNELQKWGFVGGSLIADLDKTKNLSSHIALYFPQGKLNGEFVLPHFKPNSNVLSDQKIKGAIDLQFSQPKLLEFFIPYIKNIQGNITGKFNLLGSLKKPDYEGKLQLKNASFQIPKLKLNVTDVDISANAIGKNITYTGQMKSGSGILSLKGTGNQDNLFDIKVVGSNILVCNTPEVKVVASPNMDIKLAHNILSLNGSLLIPEGNLHPHDFSSTESLSDDVVFVNKEKNLSSNSNLKIASSIQLTLGDNIFLNYKGIKGQIVGQMKIHDDPNRATIAAGQLRMQNATYSIYGRTLQIDSGVLNFTGGPISNPGLDIRASRSFQTYGRNSLLDSQEQLRVGVSVLGTLSAPKINLFSEPAGKSSADILSYLVLGMPANSVKGSANADRLLQAADAINVGGSGKISSIKNQVKKSLGLSELDISTSSEIDPKTQDTIQHTAVVLGKYLSPKFYVNYSLDIFDHTNTLKVRYLMNKFWTVQSVTNNDGSGVDILYTIERN